MIHRGDRIWFREEYRDPGDESIEFVAVEDEDGGRVRVEARIPGLSLYPTSVVRVDMIERNQPGEKT